MQLTITHQHYHRPDHATEARLRCIEYKLELINQGITIMAKSLDDLIAQGRATLAQIQQNTSLDHQSILALVQAHAATIKDLRDQLAAAGNDPQKLAELSDVMGQLADAAAAEGAASVAAVTANTIESPAPADQPAPADGSTTTQPRPTGDAG